MKKLKVFEAFAGIGAQASALKRLNIDYEIVGISEWFIDAILCYDQIQNDGKPEIKLPSLEEQIEYLKEFTFSKDSVHPIEDISKQPEEIISKLYKANKRTKNYGSIVDIGNGKIKMPDTDLLTYSFPCQDLSTGGLTKGMKKGSGTRSGLLWEIANISTYCKTKVCWERLQSIPFTFSENISGSLITDEDRTINMTRAKKEQRNTSRIDYAIEIFKKGEQYWQNLIDKASEQRACNYHDIELLEAAKKSTKTGRIVSDKQSAVIEKIVEELKKVGIE